MAEIIILLITIFKRVLNFVVDTVFDFYWRNKGERLPDVRKNSEILLDSATGLALKIRSKKLKSEDVVKAYIERIKEVDPVVNAVTDQRFDAAVYEAREIDQMIAAGVNGATFIAKPYLGVPFTGKLSLNVKGLVNNYALVSRRNIRSEEDSEAVRLIREAGGIILAVTNVPEIVRWLECINNVYGMTLNPYDTTRSVGGTTGGEGALIASCGSAVGLCTDIGGSTRTPAFNCGLFSHHPTAGVNNIKGGCYEWKEGMKTMCSTGVMSRHAEDLAPIIKILAGDQDHQLHLDRPFDIKKTKIYFMEETNDPYMSEIDGELRAALKRAVEKLSEASGAPATRLELSGMNHMIHIWQYWARKDPADYLAYLTKSKNPPNGLIELIKKPFGLSDFTLGTIISLLDNQLTPERPADWAEPTTKELRDELINKLGTDGILIFPSSPRCAPHHYTTCFRPFDQFYWAIWNALGFPATQVPLGLNSSGIPLGVQVIAAPHNDGLGIKVAEYLGEAFGGYVPPFKVV